MIYIRLEGHDFQYEVEDVLRLFYQGEEVSLSYTVPPEGYRGVFILSRVERLDLSAANRQFSVKTLLGYDGENVCDETHDFSVSFEDDKNSQYEERKSLKREVKRQIYKVLSKYTGIRMPWGVLTGIRPAKIAHEMMDKGLSKEQITAGLKDYYFVSKEKSDLLYSIAQKEKQILDNTCADRVSIYIGIPFCTTRCLYCSFTSNPVKKYSHMVESYMEALGKEIRSASDILKERGLKIQSIYVGGGTPTSIDEANLRELLESVEDSFRMESVEEYTLEAGRPDSITRQKLETIKKSRVDRISINPQTMNDEILRQIGRIHTAEDIVDAFNLSREIGFDNINMDVIAGLPGENLDSFKHTLERIGILGPESITVHTMAVKRASKLNEDKESYSLVSSNEVAQMVDTAYDFITKMGLEPYYLYRQKNMLGNLENIGYSKPGLESIYNIQIMEERQTIVALGAGAITKVVFPQDDRIERAFNVKSVEEYISRIDEMIERKRKLISQL